MNKHHPSDGAAPQRVSRVGLYLPTALLLALALVWSGFWFYAAQLAQTRIESWRAAEAAGGRDWTCADQQIGGFPFRIELSCSSVTLNMRADGAPTQVSTGALHAATQVYAPKLVLADVDGPLTIATSGASTRADWQAMRVSIRMAQRLERLSIAATHPKLDAGPAGAMAAKEAELHVRYDSDRPAEDRAVDIAISLTDAALPAADALLGSADPMTLEISGAATQALDLPPQGWRALLDRWRTAGGVFQLDPSRVAKGTLLLEGKGALSLDAAHRPQGALDVSAKGIGPLVARFAGGGIGQLAGSLFGGSKGPATTWPVRLNDGRVQFGPVRTGPVLPALY